MVITSKGPVATEEITQEDFAASDARRKAEIVTHYQAPLRVLDALRLLAMLGRPRTCVPGLFAYVIGLAYTGPIEPEPLVFVGGLLAFLVGLLANLSNTYTDVAEDCLNLPGRMWLLYLFGRRRLGIVTAALSLLMAGLALLYGIEFFAFVVIGLVLLHQYSFRPLRMKGRPWLGLYVFAQAVVGPFLIGYFGGLRDVRWPDLPEAAMLGFLFLWFVSKGMFKNVPDYDGDRRAGLRTSATVFSSRQRAAWFACGATMISYLCLPLLVLLDASPSPVLFAGPWILLAGWQCRRLIRAASASAANDVLRTDMLVSSGFLGTVLLLQVPGVASTATVVLGVVILLGSDLLAIDSRRTTDAEDQKPAAPPSRRPATPQAVFDRVAGRYDLLNSAFSLGVDRRWRRKVAAQSGGGRLDVLDVATGTASLAAAIARHNPRARVVGCDLNAAMLEVARTKLARTGQAGQVSLLRANALELPFADASFDVACIAFAIDDMPDRHRCAAELARVLRPGGRLLLLELGIPQARPLRSLYLAGLGVMSLIGRLRGLDGYRHLREEIRTYRGPEAIRRLLTQAGFTAYSTKPLTGGIAYLHVAALSTTSAPTAPSPARQK